MRNRVIIIPHYLTYQQISKLLSTARVMCGVCGKSFYSRRQLKQHTQDTHRTESAMMKPTKKPLKFPKKLITIIGIIATIGGIGVYAAMSPTITKYLHTLH